MTPNTQALPFVALLLILASLSIPCLSAQGTDEIFLFFPDVIHTANLQTGLAFANQSTDSARLTLYFIDDFARLLQGINIRNRVPLDVGSGEQISRLLPEIFGGGITGIPGFVMAETSNVAVVGFFLTFDPAIGMIVRTESVQGRPERSTRTSSQRGLGQLELWSSVGSDSGHQYVSEGGQSHT